MKDLSKRSYDVIIVGAGPAGSTLGYELARKGVGGLVLEKESIPRYKTCAGGITVKTARLLDFDIGSVTQDVVHGARVVYKGNRAFTKSYNKPLIYMVMRNDFDYLSGSLSQRGGGCVD